MMCYGEVLLVARMLRNSCTEQMNQKGWGSRDMLREVYRSNRSHRSYFSTDHCHPVEPKPPTPREVSSSSSDQLGVGVMICSMISWHSLLPCASWIGSLPVLRSAQQSSPR